MKILAALLLFLQASNAGAQTVAAAAKGSSVMPETQAKAPVKEIPMWDAKEESWGSWNELSFTDENGKRTSGWTRSLGYSKPWPWSDYQKNTGETPVFILKQTGQRKKNLPDGRTAWISVFETTETPYVVKVSKEGDRVTRKGTNLASVPYYQSHMTAQGSTMLVFPPKKTTAEKPAEKKPEVKQPVEQKPVDKKPVEKKPEDQKPVEQKPVDKKPAENTRDIKPEDKKPEDKKPDSTPIDTPAAKTNELTGFELAVIAGLSPEEIAEFKADQLKAKADTKLDGEIIKKWREKIVETVKKYTVTGWQPQNKDSKNVEERFDRLEKGYLLERLNQVGGEAMKSYEEQKKKAQAALDKGDAKAADRFIGTFRHLIKKEFELYRGQASGTIVDPRKQLEYAGDAIKACEGTANLEECTARMDDVYAGKKTAPKAPVETIGDKKDDKNKKDDKRIPTPEAKPADKNKKDKTVVPTPPLGDDTPEKKTDEKKGTEWLKFAKETGLPFAVLGGVMGMLMGGPWGWGLMGAVAVGAGIGLGFGVLLRWLFS